MKKADKDLITGNPNAENVVVFAHGAGAGMAHRFMQYFAQNLAIDDWQIIRFEFPYMQQIGDSGNRRPPNPQAVLIESWNQKIAQYRSSGQLVIAGKSMGGRIASMVADEAKADGLMVFGYPFHPSKKPEKLRTEHLKELKTTSLILQGERDSLGNREEVSYYSLSNNIEIKWLIDGDHSFKPRKKSGLTELANWQSAINQGKDFLNVILQARK